MKIYTHKRRSRWFRINKAIRLLLTSTFFLILFSALIFTALAYTSPDIVNSPIVVVGMGIIAAIIGLRMGSQISNQPSPHESIETSLKGLSKKTVLFNYWLHASHVLVSQNGIFVITTRDQHTNIVFSENTFSTNDPFLIRVTRALSHNTTGKPVEDARSAADRITSWLNRIFPDIEATAHPILLFTHPKSTVASDDNTIPVFHSDPKRKPSMKSFIRLQKNTTLTTDQTSKIIDLMNIPTDDL